MGSYLSAMQPFALFDHLAAQKLLMSVARRLDDVASQIEGGCDAAADSTLRLSQSWFTSSEFSDVHDLLCSAFAMPTPPMDDLGEFRPEWVLGHYAHRYDELLPQVMPHLASLGVPG